MDEYDFRLRCVKQKKEITELTQIVSQLKKEIAGLEKQKYEAYKRIGELTGNRTAS